MGFRPDTLQFLDDENIKTVQHLSDLIQHEAFPFETLIQKQDQEKAQQVVNDLEQAIVYFGLSELNASAPENPLMLFGVADYDLGLPSEIINALIKLSPDTAHRPLLTIAHLEKYWNALIAHRRMSAMTLQKIRRSLEHFKMALTEKGFFDLSPTAIGPNSIEISKQEYPKSQDILQNDNLRFISSLNHTVVGKLFDLGNETIWIGDLDQNGRLPIEIGHRLYFVNSDGHLDGADAQVQAFRAGSEITVSIASKYSRVESGTLVFNREYLFESAPGDPVMLIDGSFPTKGFHPAFVFDLVRMSSKSGVSRRILASGVHGYWTFRRKASLLRLRDRQLAFATIRVQEKPQDPLGDALTLTLLRRTVVLPGVKTLFSGV